MYRGLLVRPAQGYHHFPIFSLWPWLSYGICSGFLREDTCPRKDPKDLLPFKAIGILLEGDYGVSPKDKGSNQELKSPLILNLVGGFNLFEKYACQIGWFPQVGVKIKNIWNHHLVNLQTFCNLVKKIHPEINWTTWTWYPKLGNPCTYKTLQNSNFGVPSQKILGCSTKNIQSKLHISSTTGWRRLLYDLIKCLWKIYSRQTPTDIDDIRYSMSWQKWNN